MDFRRNYIKKNVFFRNSLNNAPTELKLCLFYLRPYCGQNGSVGSASRSQSCGPGFGTGTKRRSADPTGSVLISAGRVLISLDISSGISTKKHDQSPDRIINLP